MEQEECVAQNAVLISDLSFQLWNQSFATATLLVQLVAVATVCSPISSHMLLSSSLLFLASIRTMVQPLDNYNSLSASSSMVPSFGLASMVSQLVMFLG